MAITYVGGQVAGRANPSSAVSVNFALSGGSDAVPAAGDYVVVTCVTGSAAGNPAMAVTTPNDYSAIGQLNQSAVAADTSMDVSRKFMGGTPDTAVTIPGTGNNAFGEAYTIQVFRGVDPTTPMDVAPVSAGATGTGRPNPGTITPVTAGAWVVICGGGAAGTGSNYTAPANFTTDFLTIVGPDTTDAMVGSGYWDGWTSGAVDPAAYTGGTTGADDSWASYTLVLRPAPANQALTPSLYSNSSTFYAPTVAQPQGLTPARYDNAQTFYAPTVAPGEVALTAGLFSNSSSFHAATVGRGAVDLAPTLTTNSAAFYAATIAPGAVALTPERYDNASTFYAPTVAEGSGPTQELTAGLVTNTAVFYAAAVSSTYTLAPGLMGGAEAFYGPSVGVGAVNLAASLVSNVTVFYSLRAGEPVVVLGAGRGGSGGPVRAAQVQADRQRSVQGGGRANTQTAKR